uniref:Uncharacterized protein LOC111111403 isoform X1 n=1 Tax=Crassostrea virginica TaxID=6565 RepID=A0A8B8BL85_CRAVI|nr:uncharacterized protein LOC111111403 isoform X1 [Crassostrea virginica]
MENKNMNVQGNQTECPFSASKFSSDSKATSGYEGVCNMVASGQQQTPPEPLPDYNSDEEQNTPPEPSPDYPVYDRQEATPTFPSIILPCNTGRHRPNELDSDDDPRCNDSALKERTCSMKKICKYSIWILIFLLISGIVALSTINQQKTDEVESFANAFPELLRGQDEEIRSINLTIDNTVKTVHGSMNSMNLKLSKVQELTIVTNRSLYDVRATMKKWFKEFKKNLTDYVVNTSYSGIISDKQLDGRCKNVTVGTCVSTCYDKCDGYYQSCKRCSGYVTCDGRVLHERNCPGALVWTDDMRRCESTSNTCNLTD